MINRVLGGISMGWLLAIAFAPGLAGDWNQWRGPHRDGRVADFVSPRQWPDNLTRVWRVAAPPGLASPIVANGRVYLHGREGADEVVVCYELDSGKSLWTRQYPAPFVANVQAAGPRLFPRSKGLGPFATPVFDGGTLYTLGSSRILTAFDADGNETWRRGFMEEIQPEKLTYRCPPCKMACDEKIFEEPGVCDNSACGLPLTAVGLETEAAYDGSRGNYYGSACSPIIAGERLIAYLGNGDGGAMVAFDRTTGKKIWREKGPPPSSSSLTLAEWEGVPQLIALTRVSLTGVSLETGETLWTHPVENGPNIATPLIYGDTVVYAAYRGPLTAITIERREGEWIAEERWKQPKLTLYMNTPALSEGVLYGFLYANRGQYFAADATTGDTLWTSEGRQGMHATVLAAGEALICLSQDGALRFIAKNRSQYQVLKEYTVSDQPIWAYPAVMENRILIRDEASLTLWRL